MARDTSQGKKIVGTIDKHDGLTPECCKELKSHCHIPFADQQIVRICFEMAKQHPEHLEMGVPSNDSINIAEDNAGVSIEREVRCLRPCSTIPGLDNDNDKGCKHCYSVS
jgi:hypothetical protein